MPSANNAASGIGYGGSPLTSDPTTTQAVSTTPSKTTPGRNPIIDSLKCIAIIAVVLQHVSFPDLSSSGLPFIDRSLGTHWLAFHVPSFLLVSGFLYYRPHALSGSEIGSRVRRLLVPYLVASLCVFALGVRAHVHLGLNEQLFALASGSAMGIYYYVFIAALCLLAIWPLSRLPDRWLDAFVILVVLISFGTRLSPPNTNMFWAMRDPTNYFFAYFVVGWWIGARRPGIGEWARRHRGALWAVCVLLLVGYALVDHEQLGVKIWGLPRFIYALTIGAMVSLYWLKVRDGHEASRWVVYLSRATYPIFLYHLIFIRLLQRSTGKALHFDPPILTSILLVGVGIGASLLLCASVNRLSPRLARNVFGMG